MLPTIVECSQNTWDNEGIILSKAARIVRRFLFIKEQTFEGDFSKQRQKAPVPLPLLNLVISYTRRRNNTWKCIDQS